MALPPSTRKIPFVGGTIYKIGQVYDIINTPCDPDPWLWVYGFWHEVPMIFAMLLFPDPIDFVQERFGEPHHKKRRRRGKTTGGRKADISPGKGLGWAAWKMTEWIDRVGWYLLIADVSVDFALNWTTLVYQWAGCKDPNHPYCTFSQTYFVEEFSHADFSPYHMELQGWRGIRPANDYALLIPAGMPASVTYSLVSAANSYFSKEPIEYEVRDITTGRVYFKGRSQKNGDGEQAASGAGRLPFTADYDRIIGFFWRGADTSGLYNLGKARFAAYGGDEIEGLLPGIGPTPL